MKRRGSLQTYDTNVLAQEFKASTIQGFCEEISLLIINVNELKSENAILNQLMNKVMSELNMFGSRMLNQIFRDVYDIGIVTIDSEIFLTNTIIKKKFLHQKKLSATTTNSDVFCLSSRERKRDGILLLTHP